MRYDLAIALLLRASTNAAAATGALHPAGGPSTPIDVRPVNYTDADGALLRGYLALPHHHHDDDHVHADGDPEHDHADGDGHHSDHDHADGADHEHLRRRRADAMKLPAVVILHDASGPDDYEKQRASILKERGVVGFAASVFGLLDEDRPAADAGWGDRMGYVSRYTGNATLFNMRIQAAVDYVRGLEEVDESRVAIVGYCMGGTGVVHYLNGHGAPDGGAPLAGAVAVHPSLGEGDGPAGAIEIPSLFLTGGDDFLTGPEAMMALEEDMGKDVADGPSWETVRYAGIGHGFSNWFSADSYDERVDARSWRSMMTFLEDRFGSGDGPAAQPLPEARVTMVDYADGDSTLIGYVSRPEDAVDGELLPVVIVLPHARDAESGPGAYSRRRATQMADDFGYIGLAADTPSSSLDDVVAAVEYAKTVEGADPTKIAIVGFSFGGTDALKYGMSDQVDEGVRVIASFHAGLDDLADLAESAAVASVPQSGASASGWGVPQGEGSASGWETPATGGNPAAQGDAAPASTWMHDENDHDHADGEVHDHAHAVEYATATNGGDDDRDDTDHAHAEGERHDHGDGEWHDHGRRTEGDGRKPRILVQSGAGADGAEDVVKLERLLVARGTDYELTRFSDAGRAWSVPEDDGYDARAAGRSFDQLRTVLAEAFADDADGASLVPTVLANGEHGDGHVHADGEEHDHDDGDQDHEHDDGDHGHEHDDGDHGHNHDDGDHSHDHDDGDHSHDHDDGDHSHDHDDGDHDHGEVEQVQSSVATSAFAVAATFATVLSTVGLLLL